MFHFHEHLFARLTEELDLAQPPRVAAVEQAEARLAAGTYGLPVERGQPIPNERLEALPTAERNAVPVRTGPGAISSRPANRQRDGASPTVRI